MLEELQENSEGVEIHVHHYVNVRLYCNHITGLCFTVEAFLRAAAVGTTPSSPLQRRVKQSPGSQYKLRAYRALHVHGGSGGVLNI